jgi:hypothetical protein
LTLLNIKLINTLSTFRRCQDSRGFFKKKTPFRYRLPRKRTKTSSSTPNLKSPSIRTPSLLKKILSISKYLCPFKRVSTPIRRNLFTKDDGNFTADLQNVSLMSLDESIGKIEVNPKEEASVVEVFQDVLDKLSDVGKKDKLLKFFKLVQDGKFPLHNIAFELFLDIVEWFDKDESRRNEIFAINSPIFLVREKVIWWSIHSVYVWPKK